MPCRDADLWQPTEEERRSMQERAWSPKRNNSMPCSDGNCHRPESRDEYINGLHKNEHELQKRNAELYEKLKHATERADENMARLCELRTAVMHGTKPKNWGVHIQEHIQHRQQDKDRAIKEAAYQQIEDVKNGKPARSLTALMNSDPMNTDLY